MADDSNHYDTMLIIKAAIQALNLTGLTGGVIFQEVANYQDLQSTLPCVSVAPYGAEELDDAFNDRDKVVYGTGVFIVANRDVTSLKQRLSWRQYIRRSFYNTSLNDVITRFSLSNTPLGTNYQLKVEPGAAVEPQAWLNRKAFVSGMVIRATFQEPRR